MMKCLRCNNDDPAYFYHGSRGFYCRKCIRFKRILFEDEPESFDYEISAGADDYGFNYELTSLQLEASRKCKEGLKDGDILLHCICGAGKTEIVVESISDYLSKGLKVAYAISRREVVIELEKRFKDIFHEAKVVSVYGSHHDELSGDLIVCTCHQLYRYYKSFDLLILDEVDAFPLKGDETLMNISINSCKGSIIFSTATVDINLEKILSQRKYKKVELFVRPSFKPLSIPYVILLERLFVYPYIYFLLRKMDRQCIIFVPDKKMCRYLYGIFNKLLSCTYVYSDLKQRDININMFKTKKYQFIFSTAVLERGVTIKDINVIILDYGNIFDQSSLIQMLGRINRGIDDEKGKAYLISDSYSKKIRRTIKYLRDANSYL